jgi:hypothetical protein
MRERSTSHGRATARHQADGASHHDLSTNHSKLLLTVGRFVHPCSANSGHRTADRAA